MTKMILCTAVLAIALAACRRDTEYAEVAHVAENECTVLEWDLRDAAARHRELAAAIDDHRLDPEQLQSANDDLARASVGNTVESRRARLQDFESRFRFCQHIRQVDAKRAAELATRLEALHEGMSQNITSHEMPTAAKTAELLVQFQALVHEVNALPLKH